MLPGDQIRLWIVVPVFDNWADTWDCLRALATQSITTFNVLLADDGSRTPPPAGVLEFPFVRYVRYSHCGFACNCNRGAADAIAEGATHLLFLNDDTTVGPHFVEGWFKAAAALPDAVLSPIVYWSKQPSRVWSSGGKKTIWVPFVRRSREFDVVTEVDVATACAMFVPSARWHQLGGFDEKFVTYYEDFDFTLRAKQLGIRTYVLPDPALHVRHKVSGSSRGRKRWAQQRRMMTSRLLFIRRHYRGTRRVACLALSVAHVALMLPLSGLVQEFME